MTNILIDSNQWLGLWKSENGRFESELLPALERLADRILFTQQLRDEIRRNRLAVFLEGVKFENTTKQISLPQHLLSDEKTKKWNDDFKEALDRVRSLQKNWSTVRASLSKAVSKGADPASIVINKMFEGSLLPTAKQLECARERKERGNPPGKFKDPLGDQITWQQFLDAAEGEQTVWIVTADRDFTSKIDGKLQLNPFLESELFGVGCSSVNVFDQLASAIKAMRASGLVDDPALTDERLAEIERCTKPVPDPRPWGPPIVCPNCEVLDSFGYSAPMPSRYGGWTYQAYCRECGYRVDTGEPYDD